MYFLCVCEQGSFCGNSKQEEIKTIETVWEEEEEEKPEEKKQEVQLSDYGEFNTNYASGLSKDYIKGKNEYI